MVPLYMVQGVGNVVEEINQKEREKKERFVSFVVL